jgi:hypothetical protein
MLAAAIVPRLSIQIERVKPPHPERNGRRERLHLTQEAGINRNRNDKNGSDPLILVVREGLEPGGLPLSISRLLKINELVFPEIPPGPQIWHWIWHRLH